MARGYCSLHWQHFRYNGELALKIRPIRQKLCKVEGCNRENDEAGLCTMHYIRWNRYGDVGATETSKPNLKSSEPERVKKWLSSRYKIMPNGCWEWTGRTNFGYGMMKLDNKEISASRVTAFLYHGLIFGSGIHALHRCDNPPCINPDHIFLGTNLDNIKDRIAKGRSNPCKGEVSPKSKLKEEQVREIRRRNSLGETFVSLAREFGIAPQNIRQCCVRNTWKHIL